jgi:RNA polymerase sigma factor (sigma-70 family)
MARANLSDFFRRLTRGMAAEMLADHSDRQLVERALAERDQAAFQAIVLRHGPMVYRVCWRVLQQPQDAEDAFQATFLVLVQKLRTLRKHASLASWLHGVAHRVALKAKFQAAARRRHEHQAPLADTRPPDDVTWGELRAVLDFELSQLPDKWRLPLILCYLEGRTQDESANQLGWSKSTLRRRLEEARTALGRRLNRRGIACPTALSAILLSDSIASAAPVPGLVASTVEAAAGVAAGKTVATATSAKVAALTEGVLKTMLLSKLQVATAVFVILAGVGVGAGRILYDSQTTGKAQEERAKTDRQPTATIDGLVGGKKVQPDPMSVEPGAEAAAKLLAASNLTDFWGAPQNRPFDKADWQQEVAAGIEKMRPHLRIQFGKPRQIEGKLNGENAKFKVSEVVFFEPGEAGPVCLWARDGAKYYFANQIAGHEEMVKWLGKVTTTIDGLVGGKKVQPDPMSVELGAEAAVNLLTASNLTDFLNPGQQIDKAIWQQEVATGIEKKRPYVRIQFGKPKQIEGKLNGGNAKFRVSEVVFFEPDVDGPVCFWARDGDKYYFANQIAGHEEMVKWLGKVQGR